MRVAPEIIVGRKRRLAELGVVTATIAVVPLTVLVLWACGWYSSVTAPRDADPLFGEREGIVWRVDVKPPAETLHVSSNPFGIGTVAVALTPDTLILVGDKEGGVGDLREGTKIKVIYKRRETTLIALCVEFLSPTEHASRAEGCRSKTVIGGLASAGTVSPDAGRVSR